jgi:hypothetical protein
MGIHNHGWLGEALFWGLVKELLEFGSHGKLIIFTFLDWHFAVLDTVSKLLHIPLDMN